MRIIGKFPSTRLRRVRNTSWVRRLISENNLSVDDLIMPIFIREGKNKIEKINSMPGVFRYTVDKLDKILFQIQKNKIPLVALFPYTENSKKDKLGSEALNENNLICKSIKYIKRRFKNVGVMTDVALDPYTSHGHDGLLKKNEIINDETIELLVAQALLQAQAGSDIIAPSDMMDGRIGKIRGVLDKNNFKNVKILSYAVKYASSFYGPFREAVGSKKKLIGDKKTYQMDFKNSNEALREVGLDIKEGADFVMVKPGMPYLDIIRLIKDNFRIPVFSYQVSGEYSMIKNAVNRNFLTKEVIPESLMSLKRAGSSAMVTYFALEIAKKLRSSK